MKTGIIKLLFILLSLNLGAQPLLPGWSQLLLGKWKVEKMNNQKIDSDLQMFLEFREDKLLMINPKSTKEAEWKVDEAFRKILIKAEANPLEAWQLKYIDSFNLSIFDTLGFTTLSLSRYNKNIPTQLLPVPISRSQICGTWLLMNIDGDPIPSNVSLELLINASGLLNLKIAADNQQFRWKFNNESTGIVLQRDSLNQKEWIFTGLENDRIYFIDNGRLLSFSRYNRPLSKEQEKSLSGKWKIMEVEGSVMPNNDQIGRFMELNADGKLYFYSNDKKEGEGTWGINSTKSGVFVISGGGTELWNIYHINVNELLLEMEGLKMLLKK